MSSESRGEGELCLSMILVAGVQLGYNDITAYRSKSLTVRYFRNTSAITFNYADETKPIETQSANKNSMKSQDVTPWQVTTTKPIYSAS